MLNSLGASPYPLSMGGQKTYDQQAANRILPEVRRLVGQIVELSSLLPDLEDHHRVALYRSARPAGSQEDADTAETTLDALHHTEDELRAAITSLADLGVHLKDAQEGLVDFLGHRDGELVELCWKLGEESVNHWHRIGEGFQGRKPL